MKKCGWSSFVQIPQSTHVTEITFTMNWFDLGNDFVSTHGSDRATFFFRHVMQSLTYMSLVKASYAGATVRGVAPS